MSKEERSPDLQRYLDRIESQHCVRPRFMATLAALLEKLDAAHGVAKDIPKEFDVYGAVGKQLDVIGELVGVDRRFPPVEIPGYPTLLSDEAFRKLILAKIAQNHWDGTNEGFWEIWDSVLGGILDASYRDNQDMSVDVEVRGTIEPQVLEMLLRGLILPKPMGVGMRYTAIDAVEADAHASFKPAVGAAGYSDNAEISYPWPYDKQTGANAPVYAAALFRGNSARMRVPLWSEGSVRDVTAIDLAAGAALAGNTAILKINP